MAVSAVTTTKDVLPPPIERYTVLGWIYKNLFNTWYNALLTFLAAGIIFAIGKPVLTWAVGQARWEVISVNIRLLMVGQYPLDQLWRVWLCLHILGAIAGLSWGVWIRRYRIFGLFFLAALPGL